MEKSSFFNSVNNDRQYSAEEFAFYFKQFLTSGLYHQNGQPALRVYKDSGMNTRLEAGTAYIEGYMYQNTSDLILTHPVANQTNPRIDRVVLRLDRHVENRYIRAFIKQGSPALNPTPPTLQRDELIYEISLAQVRVNAGATAIEAVTDERFNSSVAGLVSSLITVPTDTFQAQWEEWFAGIKAVAPALGGMRISVGQSAPATPKPNDIWIDTSQG